MREKSFLDIYNRLSNVLKSRRYLNNLNSPIVNWLDIPINDAINKVLDYIEELSKETVGV